MLRYKEGIAYIILLVSSLLIFLFFGNPFLGIIFSLLLIYGIINIILLFFMGRGVNFSILISDGDFKKGIEKEIRVILHNDSIIPIMSLVGELTFVNRLNEETSSREFMLSALPKGDDSSSVFFESNNLGRIDIEIQNLRLQDPLKIFFKRLVLNESIRKSFVIMPELKELFISPSSFDRYDMESFRFSDNAIGSDSSETVGIREYAEGDDIRHIHWKLTAKSNTPMIKEPGLPIDNKVMVLVNKRIGDKESIDECTELAASVSYTFLKKGFNHIIGWEDSEFSSAGIVNEDSFYDALTKLMSASSTMEKYGLVESYLSSGMDKNVGSYIVVTSDKDSIETESLNRLREYGNVVVFTPSTIE